MQQQNNFMQKEDAYAATEISLIDNLHDGGKITEQFANLLRSIHSFTVAPAEASLRKVRAVIALRETLRDKNITQKHAAYLGSRFDWHFPVALGARDIAMIDLEFQKPEFRQQLLRSVKQYGAEIKTVGIDNSRIDFVLDLGEGGENVTLRVDGTDLHEYEPQQPLGFILGCYGGWEKQGKVPIPENIIRGLAKDGLVLGLDYPHEGYTHDFGMDIIERDGFYLYQVTDVGKMIASSMAVVPPPEPPSPYLKISRAIREARQKKPS